MKKSSIQSILEIFPVFEDTDRGKLLCKLTKHALPIKEIENYVKSRKFLEEWGVYQVLSKYGEYFQPMKDNEKILACMLTHRSVVRSAKTLQNHVNGKRFVAALEKALKEKKAEIENTANKDAANDTENNANDNGVKAHNDKLDQSGGDAKKIKIDKDDDEDNGDDDEEEQMDDEENANDFEEESDDEEIDENDDEIEEEEEEEEPSVVVKKAKTLSRKQVTVKQVSQNFKNRNTAKLAANSPKTTNRKRKIRGRK